MDHGSFNYGQQRSQMHRNNEYPHSNDTSAEMTPKMMRNQLLEINEIISKSKSTFSQLPNRIQQDQIKVFPEDRPAEVKAENNVVAGDSAVRKPKVMLNRLSIEDTEKMQKSITEFTKRSPEMARKYGVIKEESGNSDMFSQMKADEKSLKRKLFVNDDAEKEVKCEYIRVLCDEPKAY